MTDFNPFDDFSGDTSYTDLSNGLADLSWDQWDASIEYTSYANQAWVDGNYELSSAWQDVANQSGWYSEELYDASWVAWYGPVNSEGYTAYDASVGYTSSDTSFIEPASAASTTSMISDYDATSVL